jgi:hypothetical protein
MALLIAVLVICCTAHYNSGHGVAADSGVDGKQLVATVSGFVARTGKLVGVRPLATRLVSIRVATLP